MFYRIFAAMTFLGLFSTLAMADDSTNTWTKFECGDHWLSVEVLLNPATDEALVNFDGDSQPNRDSVSAGYLTNQLTGSIEVTLLDSIGGNIVLTSSQYRGQTLWWGSVKFSSDGYFTDIGSCYLR